MSEIRALLFDTFGTLVDWRTGVITQLRRWGQERDLTADWAALALAWRLEHVPALAEVRNQQRPWADLDEIQGETLPSWVKPAISPSAGPPWCWPRGATTCPALTK